MRSEPSILHIDLDAFFAAVEQRDKPSLRGKPVVVGGIGGRGVVATASYEARAFGVHSAMPTGEARRRCPNAAFLAGRFHAYRESSRAVMGLLRSISPLVEPLSLDEAFVDLAAAGLDDLSVTGVSAFGLELKELVSEATGGLTSSVGIGSSKFIAKIASELDKPNGMVVVAPGMEADLLQPMQVTVIPGVGPATAENLRRIGVHTVADLEAISADELVRVLGKAQGTNLYQLARARDDRPVVAEREAKSISVEDTYETDHVDRRLLDALLERQAVKVTERLRKSRLSGRTVTLKVRLHDFSTHTRSATLPGPTDDARTVSRVARTLMAELDDLFSDTEETEEPELDEETETVLASLNRRRFWLPGLDVIHDELGQGWVWGSGRGVVTVRFETATSPPGRVLSFAADDPTLHALVPPPEG
jgi:DNA polymerase-4